ncbi:MAG: ribose-phosphate diphosphokinase, partial [Fusobacterium sp.]
SRQPITAKLIADLIETSGIDRVISIDLHASQIQGFFNIPIDNFPAGPLLAEHFTRRYSKKNCVVVSPDHGGVTRARKIANIIDSPLAIIDKRRPKPNLSEVMNLIGDVEGKRAIFIDDMIDTAGTITNGVEAIMKRGAKEAYICCSHAILSGPAVERLEKCPVHEVIVTDSIRLSEDKKIDKIKVLSIDKLFAEAIRRIVTHQSVSELFESIDNLK